MTAYDNLKALQLSARKANDVIAKNLYTTLMGEISRLGDGKSNSDDYVVAAAKKMKAGVEAVLLVLKERGDDTSVSTREIELLDVLIPKQASEEQITAFVNEYIANHIGLTVRDMGRVMGALKAEFDGQYNGAVASNIIKAALANQ